MYYRVMEYFSKLGYECFVYDQRGAGRTSLGKYRGRSGRNLQTALEDLDKMIEHFVFQKTKKTSEKLYLLGHLAGGGIVLDYMVEGKYKNDLYGVITTGPMIKIADSISPSPYVEYILNIIASWIPYLPWGSINTDPTVKSTITTADEWVDYLQNELMTQGNCTIGQIKNMFDRGYKLSNMTEKYMTEKINPNIKLLTIHCKNDTMTSFTHLELFFNKLPLQQKKFVAFEKGNHSLFIETEEIFEETCGVIGEFLLPRYY